MRLSFSIIAVPALIGLIKLSGCAQKEAFEDRVYTYANPPRSRSTEPIKIGPGPGSEPNHLNLGLALLNEAFWKIYSDQNPDLSEDDLNSLRENTSISSCEVFSHQNDYFARWTVRIVEGDSYIFDSICRAYRKYYRKGHGYSTETFTFLKERAHSLSDELAIAKQERTKHPTSEQRKERVLILEKNLASLDERLNEMDTATYRTAGAIAEQFMDRSQSTLDTDTEN